MGCTSSTPSYANSSAQHANATDNMEFAEKEIKEVIITQTESIVNNNSNSQKDSETNEPVLPESDIVKELLDLDRNNIIKNTEEDMAQETPVVNENKIDEHAVIEVLMSEKMEAEERRQREIDFLNEIAKLNDELKEVEEKDDNELNNKEEKANANVTNKEELVDIDLQDKENVQSDGDDVRSESSRTTRWEALADVVAELPPSLAVDHVTGQIYTIK